MCIAMRRPSPAGIITALIVVGAVIFVFAQLQPQLLFADTTPAGGDMGAHVWGPAFLRDHLLPKGRLTGWTPDWYAGFPAYHFYMVVPSLLIVALDALVPYGVAFKIVVVVGSLALPAAAWALGRGARLRFPGPPLLALAAVFFLFTQSFSSDPGTGRILGGNLPATFAGEFAFSLSLAFAVLFLAVLARALDTGRGRGLAAALLGLTVLCHIIPAIYAVIGATMLLLVRPGLVRLRVVVTIGVVGAAIASFWALPFVWRRPYLNDMGWEKIPAGASSLSDYGKDLFTNDLRWVLALAAAGLLISAVLRVRLGLALGAMAVVTAALFVLLPQGRLWNARLLPFWVLCLYLLAAIGVSEVLLALSHAFASTADDKPARWVPVLGAAAAGVATLVAVGRPLGAMPRWLPIENAAARSVIPGWVAWNFEGYERKDAYPEYYAVISTMADIGRTNGCGRAMWEYEADQNRFGTPMALMLLPFWTDGCIGSMEGLYFEASATTPYHFLVQSELSAGPSRAQRSLYGIYRTATVAQDVNDDGQVAEGESVADPAVFNAGIRHLQALGVRYYLAFTDPMKAAAAGHDDLRLVGTAAGKWEIYEVADSALVASLEHEPVVVEGVAKGGREWEDLAVSAFQETDAVPLTVSGPAEWQRVPEGVPAPRTTLPAVTVTNIAADDDDVTFDVDRVGVPVIVRTSYFPSWQASGASGPYRVTPNLMVVVPTSTHVRLHYGWTPVDMAGWVLTLLGVAAAVWLWRRGPVAIPEPPTRAAPSADGEGDGADVPSAEDSWAVVGGAADPLDPEPLDPVP